MSSDSAASVVKAVRYELCIIARRCDLILKTYLEDVSEDVKKQFSNGLGHNMWHAMNTLGMLATTQQNNPNPWQIPQGGILSRILDQIIWSGIDIIVDIGVLDCQQLIQCYETVDKVEFVVPDDTSAIGCKWWEWRRGNQPALGVAWWLRPEWAVISPPLPAAYMHMKTRYLQPCPFPEWPQDRIEVEQIVHQVVSVATDRAAKVREMRDMEKTHWCYAGEVLCAHWEYDRNWDGYSVE